MVAVLQRVAAPFVPAATARTGVATQKVSKLDAPRFSAFTTHTTHDTAITSATNGEQRQIVVRHDSGSILRLR